MINIQSVIKFSSDIEILVGTKKISYLEAIMQYIEEQKLDIEVVPKLLSPALKQKLEREATNLNLLHKESKLNNLI